MSNRCVSIHFIGSRRFASEHRYLHRSFASVVSVHPMHCQRLRICIACINNRTRTHTHTHWCTREQEVWMRGHACASWRATRIRIRDRLGMEEKWLSLGRIGAISTLSRDVRDADGVLAVECFAERFLPRATSSTLSSSRAEVARERHPNELHANFCLIFQSFPYSTGKFAFNVRTANWYASILDCRSGRLKMIQLHVQEFQEFLVSLCTTTFKSTIPLCWRFI